MEGDPLHSCCLQLPLELCLRMWQPLGPSPETIGCSHLAGGLAPRKSRARCQRRELTEQ